MLIALGSYQLLFSVKDYFAKDNILEVEEMAFWTDFNVDAIGIPITDEDIEKSLKYKDNTNKQESAPPFRSPEEYRRFFKNIYTGNALPNDIIHFRNREQLEKFRAVTKDFVIREEERNNSLKALSYEMFIKTILLILAFILLRKSFNLMQEGFDDWYNKLQKYQDLITRNQAKESNKRKSQE